MQAVQQKGQGGSALGAGPLLAPGGLRARKKLATRRALRRAALELAAERGPGGVTVEAIAEAAGVAPRTFFNHFSCKEEALVGPGESVSAVLADQVRSRPAGEPALWAIGETFARHLDRVAEDPERLRIWQVQLQLVREHSQVLLPWQLAAFASMEAALAEAVVDRFPGARQEGKGAPPPEAWRLGRLAAATAMAVARVVLEDALADAGSWPVGPGLGARYRQALADLGVLLGVPRPSRCGGQAGACRQAGASRRQRILGGSGGRQRGQRGSGGQR